MKISTPFAVAIIGLALLVVAGLGYREYQQAVEQPRGTVVTDDRPFHTEEEWTALQIAQSIADLGALSHKEAGHLGPVSIRKAGSTAGPGVYDLKGGGKKQKISVEAGIWNPATYTTWAKDVFAPADPAVPAFSSLECAKTLLGPSFDVFFSENKRVSGFLAEHPASAAGQLQAALLVGTIALNDYSGVFRDLRIPLNRMTAHLSAADALGMPASDPARQLAEAIRLTLCGQQADALRAVTALRNDPTLADWSAVLRLRNTMDWRAGREAAAAGSPALRYEYFRALVNSIDAVPAIEFMKEAKAEPDGTFWRIADEIPLSVQGGHIFAKPILGIEIKESANAARKFGVAVTEKNFDWLKEYLDTPEGSPVTEGANGKEIQVAGRNLFAGYHQRHFMQGGRKTYIFLNDSWGVLDKAREVKAFVKETLPALRYKPFLERMLARDDAARQEANTVCKVIISEHPEMVTPCLWLNLRLNENNEEVLDAPDTHAWFHPEVPQATAFEIGSRLFDIGVGDENDKVWLKALWERAPYVYAIAMHNAYLENNRSWTPMNGTLAANWLGPQADINLDAMQWVARCYEDEQPDLYEAGMNKAAKIDPDIYVRMAQFFQSKGMTEKAAAYSLEGFEKANNRVLAAFNAPWFVKYLFQKNDLPMATKVAEDAAEVYSGEGLAAYQWLMEAQGKWDKALETAIKSDERYNEGKPVSEVGCLLRYHAIDPAGAEAAGFQKKLGAIFPEGVKKAKISDFSEPPEKGVVFTEFQPSMTSFGLAKGSVVVALDGCRTDTLDQYLAIRGMTDDPQMSFIIWDGKSYRIAEGRHVGRRFGVDMKDYPLK